MASMSSTTTCRSGLTFAALLQPLYMCVFFLRYSCSWCMFSQIRSCVSFWFVYQLWVERLGKQLWQRDMVVRIQTATIKALVSRWSMSMTTEVVVGETCGVASLSVVVGWGKEKERNDRREVVEGRTPLPPSRKSLSVMVGWVVVVIGGRGRGVDAVAEVEEEGDDGVEEKKRRWWEGDWKKGCFFFFF